MQSTRIPGLPASGVNVVNIEDIITAVSKAILRESWVAAMLAMNPEQLIDGAIERNADGYPYRAAVTWPDGEEGTWEVTQFSFEFPGCIDSYIITKGDSTFTQPSVTRDADGNIIELPRIVLS